MDNDYFQKRNAEILNNSPPRWADIDFEPDPMWGEALFDVKSAIRFLGEDPSVTWNAITTDMTIKDMVSSAMFLAVRSMSINFGLYGITINHCNWCDDGVFFDWKDVFQKILDDEHEVTEDQEMYEHLAETLRKAADRFDELAQT